ncbi:MAG: 50S ribosomal protein L4 [Candidatus Omnitrophica bacterium]|nr:50S ribosomal protein L4 [Candidatus Omnitrophota bacterium]
MKKVNTRLQVYDMSGKAVDNIQLDGKLFDGKVNKALLYEVKKMYEANAHRGIASAKTRSEVSGGGQKPWRQKGTGRARVGSTRNPIWTHGGVTFPPKPRNFGYSLPKKALKKALLSSLNARLKEELIKPVVKIEMEEAKTKKFKAMLDNLKVEGRALVIVDSISDTVKLSSRNIKQVSLKEGSSVCARDVLVNDYLVIEKEALEKIAERLK